MRLLWYLVAGVIAAVVLLVVAWTQQRRLTYFPEGSPGPPPAGWSTVTITTEDGLELDAWYRDGDAAETVVILFPGNGGNRSGRVSIGDGLADRGLDVLLVDYRGYGGNPGSPSEEGLADDARSAVRFATSVSPTRSVIYLGESLGAAVATRAATEAAPDALVLISPFTSLPDVAAVHYPWAPSWLIRESFPSLDRFRAGRLEGIPTFVIAGTGDSIVPVEQSRRIAEAAAAEFYEVAGAEHDDPSIRSTPLLMDRVAEFIRKALEGSG